MLKSRYSLGLLSGIVACLVITGLVGQVMANNFSGPASEPPNGRVVPTLDGLVINGDLTVNGNTDLIPRSNSGDDVYIKSLGTSRIMGALEATGPNNTFEQNLRLSTGNELTLSGSDVQIGQLGSGKTNLWSNKTHVRGDFEVDGGMIVDGNILMPRYRKIGSQYDRYYSKTVSPQNIGSFSAASVSCEAGTILRSCSGYIMSDSDAAYVYGGSNLSTSTLTCTAYMRQAKTTNRNVQLAVRAHCVDPLGQY